MHFHQAPHTHTLVTTLPAARADPAAICQQKSGLPTAREDGHEYLCFPTSRSQKAGVKACTAVHATLPLSIYLGSDGEILGGALTERRESAPLPITPAGIHNGEADASVLVHVTCHRRRPPQVQGCLTDKNWNRSERKVKCQVTEIKQRDTQERDSSNECRLVSVPPFPI